MNTRQLFLFAVLCILPYVLSAQKWSLGIQSGISKAWYYNDYSAINSKENTSFAKNGLNLSVLAWYKLNKYIQIGVEPGMAQRMATPDGNVTIFFDIYPSPSSFIPTNEAKVLYTNFLQIPLLAKVSAPLGGDQFSAFVKAGIGPSWMSSAEKQVGKVDGRFNIVEKVDFENDSFNMWDFGLFSGIGLQMELGPGQAQFGFDQYSGFVSYFLDYKHFKSRSYGFSLGYAVNL
jgi:hypothetical protein